MKTNNWMRHFAWGVLGLVGQQAFSQATIPNNGGGAGAFLGWDAGANQILDVKNEANQPIDWYTTAIQRITLLPDATYTIGGFPTQIKNGSLLLSPNVGQYYSGGTPGPFSLLHLAEGDAPNQAPYRDWFSTGITFTKGNMIGYVGPKPEASEEDSMVLHWGGTKTKNRMRFVFTEFYDQPSATGTTSLEGMEFMRLYPSSSTEPYVGIGDWYAANINSGGAITEPEERLDIVDGNVRIRELPAGSPANTLNKYMVVDDDGVVHYRDLPAGSGCEWNLVGNNPVTAYDGNLCPPQAIHRVGIGTSAPLAKLHVVKDVSNGLATERGVYVQQLLSAAQNYGVDAVAVGSQVGGWNYGVRGYARNAGRNYGVFGEAVGGASQTAYGVFATCTGPNQVFGLYSNANNGNVNTAVHGLATNGAVNIGVNGTASGSGSSTANYGVRGAATGPNSWAGWFDGNVNIEAGNLYINQVFAISDESLKTDVSDAGPVMDLLLSLQPRQYEYAVDLHPELGLPQGKRFGLIAQELEEHLPELVSLKVRPAQVDTTGEVVSAEYAYKTVDYSGLVPILLAGLQEQQHQTQALQEQLATLQEALAACCAPAHDGAFMQAPLDSEGEPKMDPAMERLLRIDPNPFTEATTVRYTLERAGRVQLLVNSGDGKRLQVLHESLASAGDHSYDWNTGHLAPGVYYVTLLLDGEPLVKRAVKVR